MTELKPGAKAPRIMDVARLAGVSTATVSRTLTNPALVTEATRHAVEKAIAETGYTVNMAARNLRQNRTGGVLALVPNLANPFFSKILAGISSVLRTGGINLLVADTTVAPDAQGQLVNYANRSRTDGLIILDGGVEPAIMDRRSCPPIIQACEWVEGLAAPRIMADNRAGAHMATRHLVDLGHRWIGHLTGPAGNPLTRERAIGHHAALAEAAFDGGLEATVNGDFTLQSGQAAVRAFLQMQPRPTAIVCDNDEMACGLIAELRRHGLDVPADISVVGFDDIELAEHVTPALTTIRQPREEIGAMAARAMLGLLDGAAPAPVTVIPVELVVRASTGAPRIR